jgi:biofilm protein TabA
MKDKIKNTVMLTIMLQLCFMITSASHQNVQYKTAVANSSTIPSDTSWTKKKAQTWFNSHEWLHGLKLKPHQSIDQLAFARQYATNKSRWDKAFAYLKATDMKAIKAGHYQIEGEDVYANVTEAPLKEFGKTQYEAHQNYSDIHLMISGKEKIGVASLEGATVKTAYDPAKEVGFWNAEGKIYTAAPGTFFIFFPENAHRPSIKEDGQDVVKKIVVKVRSAGK